MITPDSNLVPLEEGYRADVGHGSSSEKAYSVEARIAFHEPGMIGKQIFDNRWRTVKFDKSAEIGVPNAPVFSRAKDHGLFGHSAAQALRWWLHAEADANHQGYCLQTRIVEHRISTNHKVEAQGSLSHYPPLPEVGVAK